MPIELISFNSSFQESCEGRCSAPLERIQEDLARSADFFKDVYIFKRQKIGSWSRVLEKSSKTSDGCTLIFSGIQLQESIKFSFN